MTSRDFRTDENDAFERPRRHTKPRTKDRPDYSGAEIGVVITVDRGRYGCVREDADVDTPIITAMRARELGRKSVVVGDRVAGRTLVVSTLDNLNKGSSGQALQNANLMLGLPETEGLMLAPIFP